MPLQAAQTEAHYFLTMLHAPDEALHVSEASARGEILYEELALRI